MQTEAREQLTTVETAKNLGLSPEEFDKIKEILGRKPNFTELSIYSVMWSEHCSYKNSIIWLKTLPRKGKHLLSEAGEENAGLVGIGEGLAVAFKIESHNHPSAIEPYQGAATGVGGIHRDIFTMGARPIAALNSLRFGDITKKKTKRLLEGVVKGIGDYGNAFGVPTVAGEVYFNECYDTNPLVNAMSVGIVETGKVISATSKGAGNPVFIVGSATGKDGIHGATFASEDISDDSAEKLPAVQVGDPFQEKLLLEATLELIETGAIVGMQDMGAAGITCSTCEMSAKGEHGMNVFLDKVPTRQQNMRPFEILLSESQERMLIIVEKGREADVRKVFDKWDLHCEQIGDVVEGETIRYFMDGEIVAEVPAESLVLGGGAPVYKRDYREPKYFRQLQQFKIENVEEPVDLQTVGQMLATHPNIASKRWIYRQYDSMVGIANLATNKPSDAAVVRIPGSNKCLALTVDCNSRYVWADPYIGAAIAVSEAARNITCSGGTPSGITNCLNFGNPMLPEVYWQFVGAINGMGAACEKFETPVTGGNVSFYNQRRDGEAVFPTPTIGMLGLLDHAKDAMTLAFSKPGDKIYLIGEVREDISSSQYLVSWHKEEKSPAPYFNLDEEYRMQQVVRKVILAKLVNSAHDLSEGGLFIALLESAMAADLGFSVSAEWEIRKDAFLFGEAQGRVIVSVGAGQQERFESELNESGVSYRAIGAVTSGNVEIDESSWGVISGWKDLYDTALEKIIVGE